MSDLLTDRGFPPLSSLRLIVPPLQLVSAALLEIVKQGAVMYFGLLAEFITTVLETAPELLTDTERLQLVIGLRAKAMLELCRSDTFTNQQAFQLHLSYITNQDTEIFNSEVKASVTNFLRLVHTLMEDQHQRENFYQNTFQSVFGPKYDSALQALMRKFLFNLQEMLPVPSFEQTTLWLSLSPSITKECLDFMNQPTPLKTLIQHQKHNTIPQEMFPSGDDCILSSLSYHLTIEEDSKGDSVVKSEPIYDSPHWQIENLRSSEPKQVKEEDFQVLCSESERNIAERRQCADYITEDQGASVEVMIPPFDETESNDEPMDRTFVDHLKTGHETTAKKFNCHVCGKDFDSQSKLKKHMITHSASVTKTTCKTDSVSQSKAFENNDIHSEHMTSLLGEASSGDTDPSSFASANHLQSPNDKFLSNSELSRDDCSLVCRGCTKVIVCRQKLDKHQRICAAKREQAVTDYKCSIDLGLQTKPNPNDEINKLFHVKTFNTVPQKTSPDSPQDKMCNESGFGNQCSVCRKTFTSSDDLMRHMRDHSEQSPHRCSHCRENFDSYEDCKTHQDSKCGATNAHSKDSSTSYENEKNENIEVGSSGKSQISKTRKNPCKAILTCPECGQHFTYCKRFEEHLKKCSEAASKTERSKNNYLIINGCDFFSVDNTKVGLAEISSEINTEGGSQLRAQTFRCTMCKENFPNIALLQTHYSESHNVRGPYPCALCKSTFVRLCELVRHQQNKQLFICPTCKKGLRTSEEIKRHKNVHKPRVSTSIFTCETCGRSFKFRVNLIMHQRKHRERPPNVCSHCGKQFSSKDSLKAHMVRHTDGFPCPECGKIFYQKTVLTYHMYKHKGEEPYLCDKCGKGWPNAALLKVHMVKHREDRPFKCKDCGATYKWESSLISHHRSKHVGLRPCVCEVCSKAFRIKSELKKHMMVHSGERPCSCPVCGKKFSKGYNLKKHRQKPCR